MRINSSTRTLRRQALELLRDDLLSGRLRPGERVNEVHIAAEIGVSRGTLREAIRNLEQEGLLVSVPHRGTYVRPVTVQEVEELQDVRLSLETTAAVRVASIWNTDIERVLDESLAALEYAYVAPLPFADRVAADIAFHETICEASGNGTLLRMWRSLVGTITVTVSSVGEERMTELQNPDGHRPLLDAMRSGDEQTVRDVFRTVFEDGKRVLASAVAEQESERAETGPSPGSLDALIRR